MLTAGSLELLFYMMSNNLQFTSATLEDQKNQDLAIVDLINESAQMKGIISVLHNSKQPSARILCERIYASVVRVYDTNAAMILFRAGADPGTRVVRADSRRPIAKTAVNWAISSREESFLRMLLEEDISRSAR